MPVKFHCHTLKPFWNEKMANTPPPPNSHFFRIFVIKDPLKKLEATNQNSTSIIFWAILLCTFTPNIRKIGWKLREPIKFEKRLTDGWTAQHRISSADYVNSGAKNFALHWSNICSDSSDIVICKIQPWQKQRLIRRNSLGGLEISIRHQIHWSWHPPPPPPQTPPSKKKNLQPSNQLKFQTTNTCCIKDMVALWNSGTVKQSSDLKTSSIQVSRMSLEAWLSPDNNSSPF